MRAIAPPAPRLPAPEPQLSAEPAPVEPPPPPVPVEEPLAFDKVIRVSERTVSLRMKPKLEDAVLLILLGQKLFRLSEAVSGAEMMAGLRQSGFSAGRVDGVLMKHANRGMVVAWGKHRNRRYRLSTDGMIRAERVIRQLTPQSQ